MAAAPDYWLVVPAAGRGLRMGGSTLPPKQYRALHGATVIEHALAPFLADSRCRGVVVALSPDDREFAALAPARDPRVTTVAGGAERRDSVANALAALESRLAPEDPWVLVHDAVRPCVSRAEIDALLEALPGSPDGALLALPLADTLKREGRDGRVAATLPRAQLWRALTPQAFRLRSLGEALARAPAATDEANAIEAGGGAPRLVPGSPANLKLTLPGDIGLAERILAEGAMRPVRIGFGTDVHAFGPGDHVMLGGLRVPHSRGVVAHSDGDVLLHALCDALLGAAALGDIGEHFPDSDPRWRGVAGLVLLTETLARVSAAGFRPLNVDLTLIAEQPKLAPHREAIRARIAAALGVAPTAVNVKATTTEGLGFLGRQEGIAAEAAVLLEAGR